MTEKNVAHIDDCNNMSYNPQRCMFKDASVMNIRFNIYTYKTPEGLPGTLIVHPDLVAPFDSQALFEMDNVRVTSISLYDILCKGFIKLGDTDMMDMLDIEYPLVPNATYQTKRIVGRHMEYTQSDVQDMIGVHDLLTDPATEIENAMIYDDSDDWKISDELVTLELELEQSTEMKNAVSAHVMSEKKYIEKYIENSTENSTVNCAAETVAVECENEIYDSDISFKYAQNYVINEINTNRLDYVNDLLNMF